MIWPGRNLAMAALVPALLSLVLLVPRSELFRPVLIGMDVLVGVVALADLTTLIGVKRLRASRACGSVFSIGERQQIELTVENPGRLRRTMRIKDDVPEPFELDPSEFFIALSGAARRP